MSAPSTPGMKQPALFMSSSVFRVRFQLALPAKVTLPAMRLTFH